MSDIPMFSSPNPMTSLLPCPPLPPPPANFGVLPAEIWIVILECSVDNQSHKKDTYTTLARTCRTLNRIVTPYLWEHVVLTRPNVYSFVYPPPPSKVAGLVHVASACARTLKKHDDIAACVKRFTLNGWFVKGSVESSPDYPALEAINHVFEHVISALQRCRNLQTLHLKNVQIPPKLHRALYHLHSLRSLALECCNISCRGETCAWNPQRLPLTSLKLCQTSLSVHGYQHPVNSVEALAEAAGLETLEIDAAIFDHLMNLYITRGIPPALRKLRATPPMSTEVSGALLTDFLCLPDNPVRSISILRGFEGFVSDRVLPAAMQNLKEVAGPKDVVLALTKGRAVEGVKVMDTFNTKEGLQEVLVTLGATSLRPITSLGVKVNVLDREVLEVVVKTSPFVQELLLEYTAITNELLEAFPATLTAFVQSLPHLRTLTLVVEDRFAGMDATIDGIYEPPRSAEEIHDCEAYLPLEWGKKCHELMEVALVRDWAWKRRGVGHEWLKLTQPVETAFAF